MDFTFGEDQRMLADSLGRYLQQRYPIEVRNRVSESGQGWSAEHWSALAELGVVGALVSERLGGYGGSGFDIAATFERLGAALSVEPFLGVVLAGRLLPETQAALVEPVIAGQAVVAVCHEEPTSRFALAHVTTRATRDAAGQWSLSGRKIVIPQLEAAGHLIVSARIAGLDDEAGGIGLFLVEAGAPGVSVRGYAMIDGGRGGDLTLAAAPATLLSEQGHELLESATAAGVVALCWEAVGIMDVLKASTVEYLRTRKQFGAPIGKFQALQHRMATLALEIEQARSAAINAAAALDGPRLARERAASAAKVTIGRVGALVAEEAIQMHGGIGMTWELPLSHYAKRLTMIGQQFGDDDHHLQRFLALGA